MDQLGKMMWWLFDCPATLGFNGDNSEKARPKSFFVGSEELDPMLCATADGPEAPTRPSILLFSFDQQLITIEGIYLMIFQAHFSSGNATPLTDRDSVTDPTDFHYTFIITTEYVYCPTHSISEFMTHFTCTLPTMGSPPVQSMTADLNYHVIMCKVVLG